MANETKIVTKKSITADVTPADLLEGELAVNIPDKKIFVGPVGGGAGVSLTDADAISYNNSASGLTADNIQLAIDELDANVDAKPDQSEVDDKANTADLGAMAYEDDVGVDGKDYVRKDDAWAELVIDPYVNPFGFMFGNVNADGTVGKTSGGYTPSNTGAGIYRITFDTSMAGKVYTVLANTRGTAGGAVVANAISTVETDDYIEIQVRDAEDSNPYNNEWTFHLIYMDSP